MKDLAGKVAFITGAASGIGFGIAQAFAGAGMKLVLADVDFERMQAAARELHAEAASVLPIALDIRDRDGWTRAADAAEARFGCVHVLCNNAGIAPAYKPIEEMAPEDWDLMLQVNLTGTFNGVRTFVPRMKAHGQAAHIINVSSMSGLCGLPGLADYAAAKFGVVGLSDALRMELAPAGIGVSVVCPGAVKSLIWRTSRKVRGLSDITTPPQSSMGGSASPTARDPAWVGRRVLRALGEDEFYVFTHPERQQGVQERFAAIMAAFDATASYLREDPTAP